MGYLKKVLRQRKLQQIQTESFRKQFYNCAFWHWNISPETHKKAYDNTGGRCCFNHLIGLPVKNEVRHPIYSWQREIFSALEEEGPNSSRLTAILKGRSVGGTEFLLRYLCWKILKDNQMSGTNVAIVTGIREELAIELIRRFKNLLPNHNWDTKESLAILNGCRVSAFPTKRVKDIRGLDKVSMVIIDEIDHHDLSDQEIVLPVVEGLIPKSNPQIVIMSTPGQMNSLMHKLYNEPADKCRYKRLYLPIQKATGTLISEQEAQRVRRSPGYLQEFELRFGYSGTNTIFDLASIDRAVTMGKNLGDDNYLDLKNGEIYSIGCDPGGFGHSKFGIVMVGLISNKLRVLAAEEHASPVDEDAMIKRLLYLRNKTPYPKQTKIYIDSSNVSFIKRLKSCIPGERVDYQEYLDYLRKRKLITPPDESQMVHWMTVVPISFSKAGPKMLANLYAFMIKADIVIHPRMTALIAALQSARNIPNRSSNFILDKTSQSLDCLDALRLSLWNFDAGANLTDEIEEGEGEGEEIYVHNDN